MDDTNKIVVTVNDGITTKELETAREINELLKQRADNSDLCILKVLLLVVNQQFSTGNVIAVTAPQSIPEKKS